MILTNGQEQGLAMARKLKEYKKEPRLAVLAGYAGTGKTTLLKMVAEELGYPIIVAPTGKAALRVKEATGVTAKTIHSWMYDAKEDENTGEVSFSRKGPDELDVGESHILVIDEASMVYEELWDDIYDSCVMMKMNILIVGDPFQLPPVQKSRDSMGNEREFNLLSEKFTYHERVLLTEVVRQALESPIIRASMMVREGDPAMAVFQLPRIKPSELVDRAAAMVRLGGVAICHRNETRNKLNVAVRRSLGKPDNQIQAGEPLLVLQNNYRLMRFNGESVQFQGWIDEPAGEHKIKDWIRKQEAVSRFGVAQLEPTEADPRSHAILCEEQVFGRLGHLSDPPIVKTARTIFGRSCIVTPEEAALMSPEDREQALGYPFLHANFGYVMTCHKSQGSEWNNVLVVLEPSLRMNDADGKRWLYTAITRAKESVTLCLGARV